MNKNIFLSMLVCSIMTWQEVKPASQTPAEAQLLTILSTDNATALPQFIQDNPTFNWTGPHIGYGYVAGQSGMGGTLYFNANNRTTNNSDGIRAAAEAGLETAATMWTAGLSAIALYPTVAGSGSNEQFTYQYYIQERTSINNIGNVAIACVIHNAQNCLNYLLQGNIGNLINSLTNGYVVNVTGNNITSASLSALDYIYAYSSEGVAGLNPNNAPVQNRIQFLQILQQIAAVYQAPTGLPPTIPSNIIVTLNDIFARDDVASLKTVVAKIPNFGQTFPWSTPITGLPWPKKTATIFTAAVWFNAANCLSYLLSTFPQARANGALNAVGNDGRSATYYAMNSFNPDPKKTQIQNMLSQNGGIVIPHTTPA